MKLLIVDYTFSASAGTVTFDALASVDLDRILLVSNATSNQRMFIVSEPKFGGTVNGNVLDLEFNTDGMSDSDQLTIFYDITLTSKVDEVSNTVTYVGFSDVASLGSAAVWQIQKLERVGKVTSALFADGDDKFDNIWDNRAALTYS